MKRLRGAPGRSKKMITRPYPIVTLFSEEHCQTLLMPPNKVKFALHQEQLKTKIARLKLTNSVSTTCVLAANQVGVTQKIITKWKFEETSIKGDSLLWIDDIYNNKEMFEELINPEILYAREPVTQKEECVSFPFIHVDAWRYNKIGVRYLTLDQQEIEKQLIGPEAWAFQHGYDFFFGRIILDWRLHFGNIKMQQDVRQRLPKTTSVIDEFSTELEHLTKEYDYLKNIPEEVSGESFFEDLGKSEVLSIEKDFILRIAKHYRKEMIMFMERLQIDAQEKQKNETEINKASQRENK